MPSPRRMRLLMLAGLVTVVVILFYSSRFDTGSSDPAYLDFYHQTKKAMDGRERERAAAAVAAPKADDRETDEATAQIQERLKAAEQKAKDKANAKGGLRPDPPSEIVGVGSSADGQKLAHDAAALAEGETDEDREESNEEHETEAELKLILKKSPTIIFSKTYCPFSKRAKELLLHKYLITPEPYVVELDEHPLGPYLQAHLLKNTGRKTVPNILVNGISLGGSDELAALDKDGTLIDKVEELGNDHVQIVLRG